VECDKPLILWLDKPEEFTHELVGGKAHGLAGLVKAGIPVPPGFVVTSEAYRCFIRETRLRQRIMDILKEEIRSGDPKEYKRASNRIRSLIIRSWIPKTIVDAIKQAYRELQQRLRIEKPRVAVRSSATLEDLPEASFAGQQDTYLNIAGEDEVVEHVKKVWASLWTDRALSYRDSLRVDHDAVFMAVVVQKMVNSRSSGVMFTIHPVTGDKNKIVIESIWGLGEYIVGGKVTPDEFIVDKETMTIETKRITTKTRALFYDPNEKRNVDVKLPTTPEQLEELRGKRPAIAEIIEKHGIAPDKPSLSDEEVTRLASLAQRVAQHFGKPMDIEWAIDYEIPPPENLFLLQARPVTGQAAEEHEEVEIEEAEILAHGIPASPGMATGKARIVLTLEEAASKMEKGDILVTKMTDPDWVPYMKIASAIVTDEGGMTAHAAIVSRELGIPAVVGTGDATTRIPDGIIVTVDGSQGIVYKGKIKRRETVSEKPAVGAGISPTTIAEFYPVTATKIYMNLGQPDKIEDYLHLPFDGIGLMRIEFIITNWIGEHPLYLINQGRGVYFIDKLAEGIARVARAIYPRPVVVRFSDFKSNEYRKLKGGEKYEPEDERNPMLGWRGVSRYVSKIYEPAFRLEVRAIKKVRDKWNLNNVWVMFPFVRTTWELRRALRILEEEGLERGNDFKVWIMAEVPSTVILAEEFAKMIDGFSVGSNDLTQLVLGVDRDSSLLYKLGYFDERDPAVMKSIEMLTRIAHKYGRTVSICGQAPSVYPEVVEYLVKIGVDSISVNPDAVIRVRRHVASLEQKLIIDMLRKLGKNP